MAHIRARKTRKGRNFNAERREACVEVFLFFHKTQSCGNGQRNSTFWDHITHFNQSKPRTKVVHSARSLETKWGHIKHNVAKFCGAYMQVFDCRESGMSFDDVIEKTLQFYRDRHPKQQAFVYLHCW